MNIIRCTLGGAILIWSSFWNSIYAQNAPTLREIIDSALVHDYNYANKQLSLEVIELDQERLKDVYMPHIEFSAKEAFTSAAFDLTTPQFFIPQMQFGLPEHSNRYQVNSFMTTADLKANFVIFAGGKVGYLKKANLEKYQAQSALLKTDRTEIIQNITAVYDQLAMLKEVKNLLDESKKRLDENLKTASKALDYGLITQFEYNKITLAQAHLDAKYKEYEGKRKLVLLSLHTLTKIDMDRLGNIDADLAIMNVHFVDEPQDRAELVALEAAVRATQYKVKAAKTWWIPKVGASASMGYLGLHNTRVSSRDPFVLTAPNPLDKKIQNFHVMPLATVGVGLKWDIFDGREGITETKKAKLELKMAENNHKDAQDKIGLQLQKNRIELELANDQIVVQEASSRIAENSMEQAVKEFKVGLIKSTQLLEAENDLQQAKLAYNQAVFQQRRAALEYLKAAGTLESTPIK